MQVRTGVSKQQEPVGYNLVSSNYFSMMGIPMVAGRVFSATESEAESAVAVVSEATAKRLWPDESALGKTLLLAKPGSNDNPSELAEAVVVGVARDVTSGFVFQGRDTTCLYLPASAHNDQASSLLVRMTANGSASTVRELLVKHRPKMAAAADTFPMQAILDVQLYPFRAMAWIGTALGIVALFLSLSGMYGVMSFIVTQRKREIGIRMALGATARSVVADMMKSSCVLTLGGLAVGFGIAWSASQVLRALVPFHHLLVTGWVDLTLVLSVIGFASSMAAFIPSSRAALVDPAETLRAE
jgi:hypothetical protein